jgi:hypothetical protein
MVVSDLVSVIIPTYNRASLLARAVNSVLAQTYRPIEIIVVDDGSTDDTGAVLEEYGDQIIAIRQDNQGRSVARNTGLRTAKGKYIAFLDSDDFWAKEKLKEQVMTLQAQPDAAICYSWWVVVDCRGCFHRALRPCAEGDIFPQLFFSSFVMPSHVLARRECFFQDKELALCFDPSVEPAEDWKLFLQLSLRYHFCYVPKYLMYYTEHPESSLPSHQVKRLVDSLHSIETFLWQEPRAADWLQKWGGRARAAWRVKIAYLLFRKGRSVDAFREFIHALQMCPTYLPAYTGIGQCLVGRQFVERMIHIYNAWRFPEIESKIPQFELCPQPATGQGYADGENCV